MVLQYDSLMILTIATLFRASITRRTINDPSLSSFVRKYVVQLRGAPEETASLSLQTVSFRQSYIYQTGGETSYYEDGNNGHQLCCSWITKQN
jgi:hypothetical protein